MTVATGLDRVAAGEDDGLAGRRIGLITNHTGRTLDGRHAIDVLRERCDLRALFAPEHGIRGEWDEDVPDETDAATGLPVRSLYGATRQPTPEMLDGLDALVFDIQDVGLRFYTYSATLLLAQEAAVGSGVEFMVLDRPNPLGGVQLEGPALDPAFRSFVAMQDVPVRHGLTVGELARLAARQRGWPEPLVVPVEGWRRGMWWDDTGREWRPPSPALPTLEATILYVGAGLVEGTTASEGRGTERPFALIGAPDLGGAALARDLLGREIAGVGVEPARFTPLRSKHAGQECDGVALSVTDRAALRPLTMGLHVVDALRRQGVEWRRDGAGGHWIDRLLGTDRARLSLDAGTPVDDVAAEWESGLDAYRSERATALIYPT